MGATPRPAYAVLTAAGSGSRLGADGPKALVPLEGISLLVWSARHLAAAGMSGIVVTAPAEHCEEFRRVLDDAALACPWIVVPGSAQSRQASVARGLAAIPDCAALADAPLSDTTPVLIHDAARPLVPADAIGRVLAALDGGASAVIPAIPVVDTLKRVGDVRPLLPAGSAQPTTSAADVRPLLPAGSAQPTTSAADVRPSTSALSAPAAEAGEDGAHTPLAVRSVLETVDRSALVAVQTPQGFPWAVIDSLHREAASRATDEKSAATDDAGLAEQAGIPVVVVDGDVRSLKITVPEDLAYAELLVRNSR